MNSVPKVACKRPWKKHYVKFKKAGSFRWKGNFDGDAEQITIVNGVNFNLQCQSTFSEMFLFHHRRCQLGDMCAILTAQIWNSVGCRL